MKTSVVMTTYNGEKYVYDQIKSIFDQTQSPDEVIICDDCSSDSTVSIINKFIEKNNLDNWKVYINEENKGWQRNFIDAMGKATGDIIFLSDQDDIWLNNKIEYMVNAMMSNKKIKCLSGGVITIDDSGETFLSRHGYLAGDDTNRITKIPYNIKFNTITLLGCSMCLTRDLVDRILALDVKDYSHDAQACRLANLLDGLYFLDKTVIKYRLHTSNSSGVSAGIGFGSARLDKRISTISANINWLESLLKYYQSNDELSFNKLKVINETRDMQISRHFFLTSKNFLHYFRLLKYKNYYSNISMLIGDFAYCYGINKFAGKSLWFLRILKRSLKKKS